MTSQLIGIAYSKDYIINKLELEKLTYMALRVNKHGTNQSGSNCYDKIHEFKERSYVYFG